MSAKGSLGWILLAVALVVPAFMFWNWRKGVDTRVAEPRRKAPQGGAFGASGTPGNRFSNPAMNNVSTRTAVAPPQVALMAPSRQVSPEGAAAARQPVAIMKPFSGNSHASAATPAPSSSAVRAAGGLEEIEYNPKTGRDPMLSPNDIRRLADIAYNKGLRLELSEKFNVIRIISAGHGAPTAVLSNGKIVKVGDRFFGAKVRKITPHSVVFEYKKENGDLQVFERKIRLIELPVETRIHVIGIINVEHSAPRAILSSGRIVKEGDRVFGAKIRKITMNSVVFEYRKKNGAMQVFSKGVRR